MSVRDVLGRLRESVSAMKAKSGSLWQSSLSSYVNGRDDTIRAVLALIDAELRALDTGADEPMCWKCKHAPGIVSDGVTLECVECAGTTAAWCRKTLQEIDDAVREGLDGWPRMMDRVGFVRWCVAEHRRGTGAAPTTEPSERGRLDGESHG